MLTAPPAGFVSLLRQVVSWTDLPLLLYIHLLHRCLVTVTPPPAPDVSSSLFVAQQRPGAGQEPLFLAKRWSSVCENRKNWFWARSCPGTASVGEGSTGTPNLLLPVPGAVASDFIPSIRM